MVEACRRRHPIRAAVLRSADGDRVASGGAATKAIARAWNGSSGPKGPASLADLRRNGDEVELWSMMRIAET